VILGPRHEPRLAELSRALASAGEPFALATVVYRKAPVSAQLGDKAIVTEDGRIFGWIGGSCSQSAVKREALAAIASGQPRLLRLTLDAGDVAAESDTVTTVAMSCPSAGEISIYIEPHVAAPQIVAIGDTPVVRALARMALALGFEATVVCSEPFGEREERIVTAPIADLSTLTFAPMSFVVVAAAGQHDEEALVAALRSPARYVGLVASRRRSASVLDGLASLGFSSEELARVHTPAGLNIAAVSQEEIALSILAEIVQEYRAAQRNLVSRSQSPTVSAAAQPARDPVCGMDVEIAGARHVAEHAGVTYYFCCPRCRADFVQAPERYLVS